MHESYRRAYVADVATYALLATNRPMRTRIAELWGDPCYKAIYQLDVPCPFCRNAELANAAHPDQELVFELFNESDDHWYQLQEKYITWFSGALAKHSIAVDISALKAVQNELADAHVKISLQNMELRIMSSTDRLTGLFNRRKIDETLTKELARSVRYGDPLAVVIADVDRFKLVNDKHGHQIGDMVLVAIAGLLRAGLRETDMVGRWGGEEFLVICPSTDLDGALALAEHMRRLIEVHDFDGLKPQTASFGVAQLAADESIESLITRADRALYRAKSSGRNQVGADRPCSSPQGPSRLRT